MRIARNIRVDGQVQGVGFRWTGKTVADCLGLDGWIRNNPDGSVSIAVEGEEGHVDSFMEELGERMGMHIAELTVEKTKTGKNRDGFDVIQ